VKVGKHVAVSPGAVTRFLTRFETAYTKLGKLDAVARGIETAAAAGKAISSGQIGSGGTGAGGGSADFRRAYRIAVARSFFDRKNVIGIRKRRSNSQVVACFLPVFFACRPHRWGRRFPWKTTHLFGSLLCSSDPDTTDIHRHLVNKDPRTVA
jgi:hypothetical protein